MGRGDPYQYSIYSARQRNPIKMAFRLQADDDVIFHGGGGSGPPISPLDPHMYSHGFVLSQFHTTPTCVNAKLCVVNYNVTVDDRHWTHWSVGFI